MNNEDKKNEIIENIITNIISISSDKEQAIANEIKRLIDEGVDINQQSEPENFSLLHLAIIHCKPLIVEMMLKYGKPNLLLVDIDGNSALHMVAAYRDHHEQIEQTDKMHKENRIAAAIIEYRKTNNFPINHQNKFGNTPLHIAVINGNVYVVKLLMENDFRFPQQKLLSIKNKAGRTVLHEVMVSGQQGIEILKLLLRVATEQDLAEKNYRDEVLLTTDKGLAEKNSETPLQMLDRLIKDRNLLKAASLNLFSRFQKLLTISNDLLNRNQVTTGQIDNVIDSFYALDEVIISLFLSIKELPDEIEELFIAVSNLYPELSELELRSFRQILSKITALEVKFTIKLKLFLRLNGAYIKGLKESKRILLQSDYHTWKDNILKLPSSFTEYGKSLPNPSLYQEFNYDRNYQEARFLYYTGKYLFENQEFQQAIEKLEASIKQYEDYFPGHIDLADANYALGLCYQGLVDYLTTQHYFEISKSIYLNLQAYTQLEKVYEALVSIQIKQLNTNYQATQLAILEDAQCSNQEKLCAHLALASFYKLIRSELQAESIFYNDPLYQALVIYESYHYSLAYERMQGIADPEARLVLQREMGISVDEKLGTTNLQQCVAIFAYYPPKKQLVLAHFDRFSTWTFMEKLFSQFLIPKGEKLEIYLTGGRDRSIHGKVISDNNIDQVFKQLYPYRDQINIQAADLRDKPSPPAVIFDAKHPQKLVHAVAEYPDASLSSRVSQMNLRLNKIKNGEYLNNDYLYPLSMVDFSDTEDNRKRYFTPEELQQLVDIYGYYRSQANLQSQSDKPWFHNQIFYYLLKQFYTENTVTDNANDFTLSPFDLEQLESVLHASQNSESQIQTSLAFLLSGQDSASTVDLIDFIVKQNGPVNLDSVNPLKRAFSETASSSHQKKPRLQDLPRAFEEATKKGNFNYWLRQADIADIARIAFNSFRTQSGNGEFEIIADAKHLETQLQRFKDIVLRDQASGRLTLIINLNANHWVTLVVDYQQNRWRSFYMDSLSEQAIPKTIRSLLTNLGIDITSCNLSSARQGDSVNCGLWSLQTAALINSQLDSHPNWQGEFWDELLNQKGLSPLFFQELRKRYASLLWQDDQRRIRQVLQEEDWLNNPWQMQSCGKRSRRSIGSCFPKEGSDSERMDLLHQAENLSNELIKSNHLQPGWIPILTTAREITGGGEIVTFYNSKSQEEKTILFPQKIILPFIEKLQQVYKNLHGALKFIRRNPELAFQIIFNFKQAIPQESISTLENAETVDGLNAAFTIQALMAFFRQKSREQFQTERGPLALSLDIHTYVNFVQMAHGMSMDGVKIVGLVKTLLNQERLMEKPLMSFRLEFKQAAGEGVGTLLGIINLGLDIDLLSKANTSTEKSLFGTQLAFDSGGLILSASAMGATFLGASGTATVLSGAGVIVAGLGIGITGLVQAFNEVVDAADKVGMYFYQINDAYEKRGYQQVTENNQTYMMHLFGAVVTGIDFQNMTIRYESQFIYRTRPRSRGVFGSGKTNFISWAGDMPVMVDDKNQALNIRERLAYPQQTQLDSWKAVSTWILPYTPSSYISYSWKSFPFCTMRNDAGFSVLRKLEEQEDFDYDFYIFPSEYTFNSITEERVLTPIAIRLDNQIRTFFIPQFSKQDRELSDSIRYIFQSSLDPGGQCCLYLNKIASIRLEESHANYTWILSAKNLTDDTLLFTDRGIRIGDIPIEIPTHQAQYYFVDKTGSVTFLLDFVKLSVIPIEIDQQLIQRDVSLQEYLQEHNLLKTNTSNVMVTLTHFDLQDEHEKDYQGKAYYSMAENRLFYTNFMPKNITDGAHLVHFTNDTSYFFNREHNYVWRTDNQHQLAENYVLFSEFKQNNLNGSLWGKHISSVTAENGIITLVQAWIKNSDQKQRRAIYHIIENSPLLKGLQDDELLRSLHIYSILLNSNTSTQQKPDQYQVKLQILCSNLFTAKPGNDLNPKLPGRAAYAEFNPILAITPFTPQSNLTTIWLRKNRNDNYQLINPKIFAKQAIYLGSLFTAQQQEVFFFFTPRSEGNFGQLYRQLEGEFSAAELDLTLVDAFFMRNTLLAFTSDGVVQKIDALGKTYTLSFTKEWTKLHTTWWVDVPHYLVKNQAAEIYIPIFGITDQTGKALACWYDTQTKQFALAQPPLKIDDRQFHMTYLGRIGEKQFFYSENKKLYSQTAVQSLLGTVFQGTQLKEPIPALQEWAVAEEAYLHQEKVWLQTETGLLFSFVPQRPERWFLEKIYFRWFSKNNFFNSSDKLNLKTLRASLEKATHNEAGYLKFCFYSLFKKCDENLCIPAEISVQNASFSFANASLIPIEWNSHTTTLWWDPRQNQFFSVPHQKNGREWVFLAKTTNQNHYFFSAKEKITYILPTDTVMNSTKIYHILPTKLALRYNKVILLLLDTAYSHFQTIPLFDGVEKLELGVILSEEKPFVLNLTDEVMKHYQTITYQASLLEENLNVTTDALTRLCFDFVDDSTDKFSVRKSHHDIVIFHSQYRCQLVLANALASNLAIVRNTRIQFTHNSMNKIQISLLNIKNQLEEFGVESISLWSSNLTRNLSELSVAPEVIPSKHALSFVSSKSTQLDGFFIPTSWIVLGAGSVVGLTTLIYLSTRYFIRRHQARLAVPLAEVLIPMMMLLPRASNAASSRHHHQSDTRGLVACFNPFKDHQCVQSQFLFGILGACANENTSLAWFRSKDNTFSYVIFSTLDSPLHGDSEFVSFDANSLFVLHSDQCQQVISLEDMSCAALSTVRDQFPGAAQLLQLAEQKEHLKQWQYELALEQFRQRAQEMGLDYVFEQYLLHTGAGDYFRAVNLSPNWNQHDPAYWIRRLVRFRWDMGSISAVGLETMLLHTRVQSAFPKESYRSKLVVRFVADLLQFGPSVSMCVPSLVEILCYEHPWNYEIAMGLRSTLAMLEVINDPSTWYLAIALFVLPQLPYFLENLGIPVTRYMSHALERIERLLITCSLMISVQEDSQRFEHKKKVLKVADQRVRQGRERVSYVVTSATSFFNNSNANSTQRQAENNECVGHTTYGVVVR